VLVRSARGAQLLDLLRGDLDIGTLDSAGDRTRGVPRYIQMLAKPPGKPPKPIRRLIAWLQRHRGPRGLEFARGIIEMKMLRNLHHVRTHFRRFEPRIVPAYVYRALAPYESAHQQAMGRGIRPQPPAPQDQQP
jgi:coenzyme F420 hydrogenase subunit beta